MTDTKVSYDPLAKIKVKDEHLRKALLGEEYLLIDGGMGTQLQSRELMDAGETPELLNLTHPKDITAIHADYVAAGAEVITTNTFGANSHKMDGAASVEEVYRAAAQCAREAGAPYVAGDIGPTGALLEPMGNFTFDQAYDLFAEQVDAIVAAGCDLILIETMADLREAKAALLAAREHSDLPVFVTMTFGEDGRTFLGTSPDIASEVLSSMGAQAVGFNCSLGPAELLGAAQSMAVRNRVPLVAQPNAGLPHMEGDQTVYDVSPEEFAAAMENIVDAGASIIGGCCGTTPAYTKVLRELLDRKGAPAGLSHGEACVLASSLSIVKLPAGLPQVAVIGERINPTGKPKLKEALREGDLDYIVGEAVSQQEAGADVLDVNVGLPELDEPAVLAEAVEKLNATISLPLVIDSSDPAAIEKAVRSYPGKPLVNSVNGKAENMHEVFPIAKKYGCAVIGLTLDEGGIPSTAQGRFEIARKIVETASSYGIPKEDIVIDCLTMAVATNQSEALEILKAITMVKEELGVRTVLGVSNISFGLPKRNLMNSTFLAAALGAGLDFPILNPNAGRYRDVVDSFRVLNAQDERAVDYIDKHANIDDPYEVPLAGADVPSKPAVAVESADESFAVDERLADVADEVRGLVHLIMTGRKGPVPDATRMLLKDCDPLDIINLVFVPALDMVGDKFESGAFFLPQLMASAEAVKAGFDVVKEQAGSTSSSDDAPAIIVATVKGDIHDIGKNIVKMLLENYGYRVIDLGRDVEPSEILRVVQERNTKLVGLSALMTTTVRSMEETIELLREAAPDVKTFVGGAVLTAEYAEQIGADFYAKDAAESVRVAEKFFSGETS